MTTLTAALLLLAGPPAAADDDPDPQDERGLARRYIDQILDDEPSNGEPQFLIYPVVAYAPETRLEVGLSSLYLFHARRDPDNRLSEVPIYAFYTQNNQYGLWVEHVIFSDQSRLSFLGENRIQDFPLKYYGIGADAAYEDAVLVEARQLQLRERVLVRVSGSDFYVGPEVGFSSMRDVAFRALEGGPEPGALPRGGEGTRNLTMGAGVVRDTRHNPLNVRDGFFGELAWLGSTDGFVSDYSFSNVYIDIRGFERIKDNNVLAGRFVGQFGAGDIPFGDLGLLGGDNLMRGYYVGRYRDRNLAVAQAEMRFLPLPLGFTNRIGAAVFVATGTVFPSLDAVSLRDVRVTGGAGLRVLTFPKSDIFTRVDLGLSEDGTGLYVYVGEAF